MRIPYGLNKEPFKFSLFLVLCNRITTSAVSAGFLLVSKRAIIGKSLYLPWLDSMNFKFIHN